MAKTDWDSKDKLMASKEAPRRAGQRAKEVTDIKVRIGVHADAPVILRRRPVVANAKPQRFVSLHHHSTFSYLDGYQLPDAHVRRCTELNMSAMAMTEHGNIDSHTQFEKAAKKAGVKSIFGCEVYMPANVAGEGETQRKHHLTLIARNKQGYKNLIKLITLSWKNFYHEPTVTWPMLVAHRAGLIVMSGCQGSLLACSTVGGKGIEPKEASYSRGLAIARKFKQAFGKWYFIEVQAFPELEKTRLFNRVAHRMAKAIGTRLVATMDCHYTVLEEQEVQKILHNLRPGKKKTIEEQAREWGYAVPLCPPPNDRGIYRRLRATGLTDAAAVEAIVTTEELAQECDVELPQLPMVQFPLPEGWTDHVEYWRHLLKEGWKFRKFDKLSEADAKPYKERLKHEMTLIESKDFVNYFLLVQAGVRHIKDLGIPVGPARGSAAASIAAYLLRITEVDPLRPDFGGLLRFERFIDESREDLPDIDLDFPSRARPLLRSFYEDMFGGSDFVTNVGTFVYFRNKIALDDVARVFRVPKWEVEKVKSYLIERSSADLRASSTVEDTIAQFPAAAEVVERYPDLTKAALLEGGIKGFGVHAAALVLSNEPITNVTPLMEREVPKGSGNIVQVVGLDKHDAEYRGLLKMDFLGLNTMTMIEDMITHPLVGMNIDELYGLPLDDPKIFDRFESNDVVGVFQWDGRATRFVNGAVKPRIFRELMDINALSRPGPLHGGGTREYIETKHGRQKPESLHPALDMITAPTQYQIVYQEQILNILRQVGDFPWGVTAEIRKIISKKHGEQAFNAKHQQFMDGVATVHKRLDVPRMDTATGDKIWRRMITAGSYAFNCVTGDTVLLRGCGNQHQPQEITVEELYDGWQSKTPWGSKLRRQGITVQQMCDDGRIRPARMVEIMEPVEKQVLIVTTKDGRVLRATAEHRLLTDTGYKNVGDLCVGDKLVAMGPKEKVCNRPATRSGRAAPAGGTYEGKGFQTGSGNVSWIDGRRQLLEETKAAVRKKANSRCQHCDFRGNGRAHDLEFAHIMPLEALGGDFSKYHHKRNVMLLCNSCHKKYDYNMGIRKRRDSRGRLTVLDEVVSIEQGGAELVYDMRMEGPEHNYVTNGLVSHNAAHCAAYSLIAFYCMFFKVYHPSVFYYAALKNLPEDKVKELIRDAEAHNVRVLPPHLRRSRSTWWTTSRAYVRAGFCQVKGIGEKTAPLIVDHRRTKNFKRWNDLQQIKGIGPKTIKTITDFVENDDPFEVYKLERNIAKVKKEILAGKLGPLPPPTHTGATIDQNPGKEMPVVWLGTITQRNVRDLFEYTYSKTGEELDPALVKDPELREWVVARGEDDTEPVMLKINRWKYPKFKNAVMAATMEEDLVLVKGRRPSFAGTRQINVDDMWVIDPTEEEDQNASIEEATTTAVAPERKTDRPRKARDKTQTEGLEQARPKRARGRGVRRQADEVGQPVQPSKEHTSSNARRHKGRGRVPVQGMVRKAA